MRESEIVSLVSRKLAPYILLFGLYLISHGHLSPGGGFQGGVVLASGVILLWLSRGIALAQETFPPEILVLGQAVMFLLFLLMGLGGLMFGGYFLENFLLLGKAGEAPGGEFIFFLDMIIGLNVGAGITLIAFYLLR